MVCVFVDSSTLSALYNEFSGGQLDGSSPLYYYLILKNKNKMPPPFPIFQIEVDDKQII